MTVTSARVDIAEIVADLGAVPVSAHDRHCARLRLADTAFATLIGGQTGQGRRSGELAAELHGAGSVAGRAFRLVAACRMTEIDDIDLLSCVTPGAVVVPTVLATCPRGISLDDMLDAVVRGYEVAVGLGEAMRGPHRLATGVWPTLTVGGVTAAAVASWLLGASRDELAAAVRLAARHSVAGNPRDNARETLLAGVVATGVGCALAARHGFVADGGGVLTDLLDARPADTTRPRIHRPAIKPFCSARQAMTAVSALRGLLSDHGPDDVERVDVDVPTEYSTMLDKPVVASRRESLSSAAYQLALAVLDPAGLYDVDRAALRTDEAFRALMARVHIHPAEDLSARYPARWPARVRVTTGGRTVEATADEVPGERDVSAERLTAKLRAFADAFPGRPTELVELATTAADITALLEITKEPLP